MTYQEAQSHYAELTEEITRRAFVVAARTLEESGVPTHRAMVSGPLVWEESGVLITLLILANGGEHRYRKMIGASLLDAVTEEEILELGNVYAERRSLEEWSQYERITRDWE